PEVALDPHLGVFQLLPRRAGRAAQRRRARGETQTRGAEHLTPAPGRSVTDLPRGHPFPHRGDGRVQTRGRGARACAAGPGGSRRTHRRPLPDARGQHLAQSRPKARAKTHRPARTGAIRCSTHRPQRPNRTTRRGDGGDPNRRSRGGPRRRRTAARRAGAAHAATRYQRNRPGIGAETGGLMSDVTHHKWWGWGVEGIAFTYDDKPAFAPFVLARTAIDLSEPSAEPPEFSDLQVPDSILGSGDEKALRKIVGDHHVFTDDMQRVIHTYGKGLRDLVLVRAGHLPRVPDVVVYPANEEEVQQIVDYVAEIDAVLIPFGGGSNISGSLTPQPKETRLVVSMDMGRMNRVLEI